MRTFIFRGYDAVGKKGWVYGDLTHAKKVLVDEPYVAERIEVAHYEVYPESVGLSTGKKDRNGKEIFEGDKLAVYYKEKMMFVGTVVWHEGVAGFLLDEGGSCYSPIASSVSEIVGNVFEEKMNNNK